MKYGLETEWGFSQRKR